MRTEKQREELLKTYELEDDEKASEKGLGSMGMINAGESAVSGINCTQNYNCSGGGGSEMA